MKIIFFLINFTIHYWKSVGQIAEIVHENNSEMKVNKIKFIHQIHYHLEFNNIFPIFQFQLNLEKSAFVMKSNSIVLMSKHNLKKTHVQHR